MLRFVSFVSCALTLAVVVCGMCSSGFCGVSVVEVQQPAQITDMLAHDLLFYTQGRLSGENQPGLDGLRLNDVSGLKSPVKAVLLSLLLPGAGQSYIGAVAKSRVFYSAEAVAWVAYGGFKVWQHQKENEYKSWAVQHAGIDEAGKDDYFWQMMTYYDSRSAYEIYGRAGQPDRPSYPDVVGWDWQWDSETARAEYRELRNSAKGADRKATFTLGTMVLNRIVASLDAYRGAKLFNRKKAMGLASAKLRLKGTPFGENPNVMVILQRVF